MKRTREHTHSTIQKIIAMRCSAERFLTLFSFDGNFDCPCQRLDESINSFCYLNQRYQMRSMPSDDNSKVTVDSNESHGEQGFSSSSSLHRSQHRLIKVRKYIKVPQMANPKIICLELSSLSSELLLIS